MDVGIKIIYLMSFGGKVALGNIYHELTRTSPVFYYFERSGLTTNHLESIFKNNEYHKEVV